MKSIVLTDYKDGLKKVSLTKLLKDEGGMSLREAKSVTDSISDGETVLIELATCDHASHILERAIVLGALGQLKKI